MLPARIAPVARASAARPAARCSAPARARKYSTVSPLADIDAKKLVVTKTTSPKPKQPSNTLVFGRTFTDHMLSVEWTAEKGWGAPHIKPHGPLTLDPAAPVFHYGMACFEGMKSYLDKQGKIRMFRPMKNMERLNRSTVRLSLPGFDKVQLLESIKELLRLEKSWIPNERGYSLYIRPCCIGSGASLGVGPSNRAQMFVVLSPVGPYYPEGFKPVKLMADEKHIRAWPGGTGDCKVAGNYAPTIAPQVEAAKKGYSQILWLFGKDQYITEVGTMNMFIFLRNEKGEQELVTPPLDDGTILHGVTRDSILQMTRGWREFKVSERPITMKELITAQKQGRVIEAFGAGTAAIVAPIKAISYRGTEYEIPLDPDNPQAGAGKLAKRLVNDIMAIQYGEVPHEWSVVVD